MNKIDLELDFFLKETYKCLSCNMILCSYSKILAFLS